MRFTKELLRAEGRTVGRLDSRFTGADRDSAGEVFEFDPSMAAITGPYAAAFNDYVRGELGYESDLPYEILSFDVNKAWKWETENAHVNVAETLRKAMTTNPHLKSSRRQRLLRPRHAALCDRVHLQPPRFARGTAGQRRHELLRGGPHDVREFGGARAAKDRTRQVCLGSCARGVRTLAEWRGTIFSRNWNFL